MPIDYIGRGDLATYMGVASTDLSAALADLAVAAAMASVRSYVDQEITFHQNHSIRLDGSGTSRLRLPERPVRLVVSVTEDDTVLAATEYVLRDSILVRLGGCAWSTLNPVNVAVVYSHGYDTGAIDVDVSDSDFDALHIPADLVLATLSAARRTYEHLGATPALAGVRSETIGAYSYTLEDSQAGAAGVDLIDAERKVLDRYRYRGSG
jgi:hypothetical protein